MRRRRFQTASMFSAAVVAGLVLPLTVACSTGGDGAGSDAGDASLSSFVERVVRDDEGSPFAQYFSLERYRAGTDIADDLSEEELAGNVFIAARAELTIADPYLTLLKLSRAEPIVIPLEPLAASYTNFGSSGAVLVGDFDPEAIRTAIEGLGGEVAETDTAIGPSYVVPGEGGGIDTGDAAMDRLYADTSVLVAEDGSQVVFDAEGDGSGAIADDGDATAADQDGAPEVAAALDDQNVYAAALFFDGDGTAGADDAVLAEPWSRAGLGTSIEDGQSRAVMALWHAAVEDAEANAERVGELLGELTECSGDPEVDQDGPLVVVSCDVEKAGFGQETVSRTPSMPLFD